MSDEQPVSRCSTDQDDWFNAKQQLFPDATYMRARYKSTPLLLAYLKRLFSGLIKRLS